MANEGCVVWTPVNPKAVNWSAVNPYGVAWTTVNPYDSAWSIIAICAGYTNAMSKEIYRLGQKINLYRLGKVVTQQIHHLGQTLVVSLYGGISQQTYVGSGTAIKIWRVM